MKKTKLELTITKYRPNWEVMARGLDNQDDIIFLGQFFINFNGLDEAESKELIHDTEELLASSTVEDLEAEMDNIGISWNVISYDHR